MTTLAFSADGSLLVAGFADGHLAVFDSSGLEHAAQADVAAAAGKTTPTTASRDHGGDAKRPRSKFQKSVDRVIMLQRLASRPSGEAASPSAGENWLFGRGGGWTRCPFFVVSVAFVAFSTYC